MPFVLKHKRENRYLRLTGTGHGITVHPDVTLQEASTFHTLARAQKALDGTLYRHLHHFINPENWHVREVVIRLVSPTQQRPRDFTEHDHQNPAGSGGV